MERKLTYTKIPAANTIIVGTFHTLDCNNRNERKEFLREISKWRMMAIEGCEIETNLYRFIFNSSGSKNYELLAAEVGPKPIVYLERNADWHGLAQKYGMTKSTFETLDALAVMGSMLRKGGQISDEELFAIRGRYESEFMGNLGQRPSPSLRQKLIAVTTNSAVDLNVILFAGELYTSWYAHVRDHELMGPRLLEFAAQEGRKGVICGQNHVQNLKMILETGKMNVPPTWEDFKKTSSLAKDYGPSTEKIEAIISGML